MMTITTALGSPATWELHRAPFRELGSVFRTLSPKPFFQEPKTTKRERKGARGDPDSDPSGSLFLCLGFRVIGVIGV